MLCCARADNFECDPCADRVDGNSSAGSLGCWGATYNRRKSRGTQEASRARPATEICDLETSGEPLIIVGC